MLSMKTMRLRLCALRGTAGAALFGKHATLLSAWDQNRRATFSAFQKAHVQSSLGMLKPYNPGVGALRCSCPSIVPIPPSSPIIQHNRRLYASEFARKSLLKTSSISKSRSRTSGKRMKAGNVTRRSLTASASLRQNVSSSKDLRKNSEVKGGIPAKIPTRTALGTAERSKCSDSRSGSSKEHNKARASKAKDVAAMGTSRKNSSKFDKPTANLSSHRNSVKSKTTELNKQPQKKGKRVMRLYSKDSTAKRIYEGYPLPGEEEEQAPVALSNREQFRQIVPAQKLLQHIEKYMLGRRRPSELQKAGYDMKIIPAPLDNIPHSKKGERQPIQEEVFRHKLRFLAAAKSAASLPPVDIPEVAFAGRSNVGKSSLINALTRQWGVARTSDKPGLTQTINFFRLGGRLCLVDLPGYGFALAAEEKKEAWEEFVKEFVTTRVGLKRVYVLVDAKWGLKLKDEEFIGELEKAGRKHQIVVTKSDTVTPMDLARRVTQILEVLKENKHLVLPMIMVSSKTGEGLEFFRTNIGKLARPSLI
ncbi:hypothetical protein KP509_20G062800 [Ceratopteris richardii]|uniref:EngB-type G domain-containing protein n=2 Tax=Ceratopteris richardii TaxID=49495 RepID=A0A8T2SGJ9_CERRI|nr:hypothetical protein KP509_20G062800 [Ceratopteris richardii]